MGRRAQRLGVGSFVGLLAAGIIAGVAIPASDLGVRFLHALFAVCIVGVAGILILTLTMFVMGVREAKHRKNIDREH
jgi:Na+/serine symporter